MCQHRKTTEQRFAALRPAGRIWTIAAIHADAERIVALHDALLERFTPGDRILYFGNYTGHGAPALETVDEILTFRRMILSVPGVFADDIVYLRGQQEEMLDKLLQLPFANSPGEVLGWMRRNGIEPTLHAYGIDPDEGTRACNEGTMPLTRWISGVRAAIRARPGHEPFLTGTRRAAYTRTDPRAPGTSPPILFVHAGIDTGRPLEKQADSFWWRARGFDDIHAPYAPFSRVVRGYDPEHRGVRVNGVTATLDGGCGFGGSLVCAGWDEGGEIFDMLAS